MAIIAKKTEEFASAKYICKKVQYYERYIIRLH
jgi:hypothetical protein